MAEKITPVQIRANNRMRIYQLIYNRRQITSQEISRELELSRPTVTARLEELCEEGWIRRDGRVETVSVGRRATVFSVVEDYRIAVGVELGEKNFAVILMNLYGEILDQTTVFLEYENTEFYYRQAGLAIRQFISGVCPDPERVLGVGFSIPAKIAPDGRKVLYGGVMGNTGLEASVFEEYLPYSCTFVQDAECAAVAELWNTPGLRDAWFVNLSYHLGNALILNGSICTGQRGFGASIEHLPLKTGKNLCYCGRIGCLETGCSVSALLQESGESLAEFMSQVRRGEAGHAARYETYLEDLAEALTILLLNCDVSVLLGGEMAEFMKEKDLQMIRELLAKRLPYPEMEDSLMLGKVLSNRFAFGAALPLVWRFLEQGV